MQKTSTGKLIILFFAVAIGFVACGDNDAKEAKMIKEMTGKEWDDLLENDPEKFGRLMKKANEMGRKQREKEKEIVRKKWEEKRKQWEMDKKRKEEEEEMDKKTTRKRP